MSASCVDILQEAAGKATRKTVLYAALSFRRDYRSPINCLNRFTHQTTKAEIGDHDEHVSFEDTVETLEKLYPGRGQEYAEKIRDYTIALYKKCAEYALTKNIIIADTKFEFGLDENGDVVLGDEMLTPDSSRFWPLEGYKPGQGQPSFDKQYVRDWLKANPEAIPSAGRSH